MILYVGENVNVIMDQETVNYTTLELFYIIINVQAYLSSFKHIISNRVKNIQLVLIQVYVLHC